MRFLVPFFIGIFLASSLRAEERFSMSTTPGELPKDIIPRAYVIRLELNTDSLVTVGSESIELEVIKPTDRIVINAVDTDISQARLSGAHTSEELTPQIDSKAEMVTFQTKTSLEPGSYQLALTFQSKITEQPHGLFIQYFRIGERLERLLSTEMEPTDARTVVPMLG
jgi:aminopeptidase N